MILYKFFKIDFYTQNTTYFFNETVRYSDKNILFKNSKISLRQLNKEALYSFFNNTINIPENFYKLDNNYLQFEEIKKYFDEKALEFIIKHEFGHLNHHQFLSIQYNVNSE